YDNVKDAILLSCQKLQVKKLDMCLLHRRHFNLNMDISAWEQLIQCKKEGLVDEIGVSNYDRDALDIIYQRTRVYPTSNQIELSVNNYRADRVAYNNSKNIEIQAWSPLGDIENNQKNPLLIEMSKKYGTDVAGILIAFIGTLGHSIIVKTSSVQRVINNINSFQIKLDDKDVEELKKLNTFKIKFSEGFVYDLED
ncbi:MAG: aldo/keto reductase, partial [Malacoplasma sp.]|nr:aldo/keto reductase [Malacoplasma sp.]